ncbi:GAF domain-containing sensor histidine kinase [Nodosilinea sp. LEGE 07088]|uniref:GAF domain-containing sensor histidine kinase n=1 Tax=Nodosilinea sp. LEGE 07088 TaxID=2777968 RepID=UPI001882E51E|nr:GAF domain-containing protein [Nodosilinea sp. LEGE 07088]MBE9137160.1 GAF domain-containing sensor histidine kinase [Nodosilinea sp. LEGE 07088]
MAAPVARPACALPGQSQADRQQRRCQAIVDLGLEGQTSIPAWDEAAQLAAQFLAMPLAIVTLADSATESLRAAYGLSGLGVGNPLSQQRQIRLDQGLGVYILDSEQPLLLTDATDDTILAQSELVATYGIRAYGGVPLMTTQGVCIGTLAVMDTQPRRFTEQDLGFLAMAARWGMSEYERQVAMDRTIAGRSHLSTPSPLGQGAHIGLLSQLTQDLRGPMTTILGMATMLSREIYGPLTQKQREYTDIVCRSSQGLMTLVDEILDLGWPQAEMPALTATTIDIATLGQRVMTLLTPLADKSAQTLIFTVEPGEQHWSLDQRTVKQILYHLSFSIMQVAGAHSTLCIHACRRGPALTLIAWLANPWLEESLPIDVLDYFSSPARSDYRPEMGCSDPRPARSQTQLGLRLVQHLAQRHGGYIKLQGTADSGCRLAVLLPVIDTIKARPQATSELETRP